MITSEIKNGIDIIKQISKGITDPKLAKDILEIQSLISTLQAENAE